MKARLKDIAKALNTTIATVSRALHDHPEISEKMKNRVREVAALYNYKPNSTALSLKYQKSHRIGVIFPRLAHYYVTQILSGMLSEAEKAGYKLLIAESNYKPEKELEFIEEFYELNVDAILILPGRKLALKKDRLEKLIRKDIPFLIIDRLIYFDQINTPLISSNDYVGTKEGINHLIEQGYRKIAHMRGLASSDLANIRCKAYMDSLKEHNLEVRDEWIISCHKFTFQEGEQMAMNLMQLAEPPDAIFAISDIVAVGALNGLKKAGYKIPEDVGVLGFSNSDLALVCSPQLSSIHQPGKKIGRRSIQLVLSHIDQQEDISKLNIRAKTRLVIRDSTNKNP